MTTIPTTDRRPTLAAPMRVATLFDGSDAAGGGVRALAGGLMRFMDPRKVCRIGVFLSPGGEREALAALCDEVYDLGTGSVLPSRPGGCATRLTTVARSALRSVTAVRRLRRAIRERAFDVVHVHRYPLHLVAGLACRGTGVPCVWHWHGGYGGNRWLVRLGFAHGCDAVACISRFVLERLPPVARSKAAVVYNGVDTAAIAGAAARGRLRERAGVREGTPLVGLFGTLSPLKGQECLVRAAARVCSQLPETVFCIVGSETPALRRRFNLTERLPALAAASGVGDRVRFVGHLDEPGMWMGDCDVVCMLTQPFLGTPGEGFGLTVAEAMAAGVPVIAAACGAAPELVTDGVTGLLVPPGDPSATAEAIVRLLRDPARRAAMGQAGRQRAAEAFDIRRAAREMEDLYAAAVCRR